MLLSVFLSFSLSGCPSVRNTFFRYVYIIVWSWHFQDLLQLTKVMSMQKVKVKGKRSRSQRSKHILRQFGRFRTITIFWIHRWLQNDAQSLKWHRRGPFFRGYPYFRTVTPVWIHIRLRDNVESLKWCKQSALLYYNDDIMRAMASKFTCASMVFSIFVQTQIKANMKILGHWPL